MTTGRPTSEANWRKVMRERSQKERRAVDDFVRCVSDGRADSIGACFKQLDMNCAWVKAFKAVSRLSGVSEQFQQAFLQMWLANGDSLRSAVGDDAVLCPAVRRLLPPYSGADNITLYRGEAALNRRHRPMA
jgi:hypothetical protein